MMDLFDLTGRVALVTGGGRGLGRAMALALGQAGANVAVLSRTETQVAETLELLRSTSQGTHLGVPCDVSDLKALEQGVAQVSDHYGGLDILLNAAGAQVRKPALDVTPAEFDYLISVNLRAAYFVSQFAARAMQKGPRPGKIIQLSSLASAVGVKNISPYVASKSAVSGMVRSLALEWAPLNIRVNAIAPGYFRTDLTEAVFQDADRVNWMLSRIPLGRTGIPSELAGVALFLASDASDYMTGQTLFVDGGWLAG